VIAITAEPSGLIVRWLTLGETVEIDLPISALVEGHPEIRKDLQFTDLVPRLIEEVRVTDVAFDVEKNRKAACIDREGLVDVLNRVFRRNCSCNPAENKHHDGRKAD